MQSVRIERRKYPRASVRIIYALSNAKYLGRTSYTKDISAGGVCFISEEKMTEQTALTLSICLPEGSAFEAQAKVLREDEIRVHWTQQPRYCVAVEFNKIEEAAQKKINRYVIKYLQKNPA